MITPIYYEAHVTINPASNDNERQSLSEFAVSHGFRLAKLFMAKDQPSTEDSFMTGTSTDYTELALRTAGLVRMLREYGYVVRRYKLEATMIDSRSIDTLNLLGVKQ